MKIKEVIKNLKVKKIKNGNSINISRNFSEAVKGSVGSVQFQIVPCSSLYFSKSIGPFQCLVNVNYRFQSVATVTSRAFPSLFILASCLQVSSREGNGTPLQYSCLENPTDGGAW